MEEKVISKIGERPKTRTAWWAMALGLPTLFTSPILGISAAVLRPMIDARYGEAVGSVISIGVVVFIIVLTVSALVLSVRAYGKGERSWVLWLGFIPAAFNCLFFVFMIIGELVFPH